MGRGVAFIVTAVLGLCAVVQLAVPGGSGAPKGGAFMSLLAIAMLWMIMLWEGMPGSLRVPVLILFLLVSVLGAVMPAVQAGARAVLDRPRTEAPVVLGTAKAARSVALVYHAGGSGATKAAVTRLGRDLAARGLSVTMIAAGPRAVLDQGKYRAIVLGSPVYSGEVRPPVLDFLSANAPLSLPIFAVLTGWFPAMKDQDLGRLSGPLGHAGGRLVAGVKIGSGSTEAVTARELASIESTIMGSLGARP